MRIMIRSGVGLLWALLVVLCATSARAEGAGLHGRVFALDANGDVVDVVVGAQIQFLDASGAVVARTTSGTGGYYQVTLPAGTYSYEVTATGFYDEDVQRGVRQELTEGFSVFDFALTPGKVEKEEPQQTPDEGDDDTPPRGTTIPAEVGTLYGTVHERSERGVLVGIPAAWLRLAREDGDVEARVQTDAEGAYEIVLTTGTWHATAYAPDYEPLADADPIEITKGQRTNRDFLFVRTRPPAVPPGQGFRGLVRLLADPDASATPAPTITVSILPVTPGATQGAAPGVDPQGAWQSDLLVGRYDVVASAPGYEAAHSGPREVYAGRVTHVDLTLRPAPAATPEPIPGPHATPEPIPGPHATPEPIPGPHATPEPIPGPHATPEPIPGPIDPRAALSIQALALGPDGVLRVVAGAAVTTGPGEDGAAERTTDEGGWCTLPLAAGGQHIEVRSAAGATATLDIGFAPAERFVEVERRDATGRMHLELLLPVTVQVVLTTEEVPEAPPEPEPTGPDGTDPAGRTARIDVRVVEPGPAGRGTVPVDGARVRILLGDSVRDTGIAKGGAFTSRPLPVVGGYYAFAEKEGYHPGEEATPIEQRGPFTVVLHRVEAPEEPPGEEQPPEGERAVLLVRVLTPEGQPVRGALVEVHWGPEGRDEVRARGVTEGRDPLFRATLPREGYWVSARAELPGRGPAWGEVGVEPDWNPAAPVPVRLHAPEGPGPGEPPPVEPPAQPPTHPPGALPPGRTQPVVLQIQVLGPDGRPFTGAQVEVLWGPQGHAQVRGRAPSQGRAAIARFTLPRENYWARAAAPAPGGGRLTGQEAVGKGWNPALPIRIHLHREGGPPPRPPTQPGTPKPPAQKATLTVRVSGLDLNAPISTVQPLGGARVTVRGNGGTWSGTTNPGGTWSTPLAPGGYQIEVTAPGMERAANAGVTMGARNVTKELTIKLRGPR